MEEEEQEDEEKYEKQEVEEEEEGVDKEKGRKTKRRARRWNRKRRRWGVATPTPPGLTPLLPSPLFSANSSGTTATTTVKVVPPQ